MRCRPWLSDFAGTTIHTREVLCCPLVQYFAGGQRCLQLALVISHKLTSMSHIAMVASALGKEYTLRLAAGGSNVQLRHVEDVWELVRVVADRVLGRQLQ